MPRRSGKLVCWRNIALAVALMALTAAVGCAPRYAVIEPLEEPLSVYSALTVGPIVDALPAETPEEDRPTIEAVEKLRSFLADEIRKKKLFSAVYVGQGDPNRSSPLVLEGRVLSFKGGSRAARYFVGFGAGKGELVIELSLRDNDRGENLFVGNFKGQISGGFLGGSSDEPLKQISREFAKVLKKNWK